MLSSTIMNQLVGELYPFFSIFLLSVVTITLCIGWLLKHRNIAPPTPTYFTQKTYGKNVSVFLVFIFSVLCIVLFILPLLNSWSSAFNQNTLFGIFPASDGPKYYMGAEEILYTGSAESFFARRPINTALFALRLAVTGDSYKGALLIQSLLLSLSCLLSIFMVLKDFGKIPALLFTVLLFLFGSKYVASPLTESLGLSFGILSFTLLWFGASRMNVWVFSIGVFMLSVAFNVRPGTILILPLLILWAWIFIDKRKLDLTVFRTKGVLLTSLAVLLGSLLHIFVIYNTSGTVDSGHENAVHLVYAASVGETGWKSFQALPQDKQDHLWQESWQEIKSNPVNLVKGLQRRLSSFLIISSVEMFQTVSLVGGRIVVPPEFEKQYNISNILKILAYNGVRIVDLIFNFILLGGGILFLYKNRQLPEVWLVIFALVGFVFSGFILGSVAVPRVIQTTLPFILFLYVLGAFEMVAGGSWKERGNVKYQKCDIACVSTMLLSSFLIIAILCAAPVAFALSGMKGKRLDIARTDENFMIARCHTGLPHINILPDSLGRETTFIPRLIFKDYKKALQQPFTSDERFGFTQLKDSLTLELPLTISLVYNFSCINKPRATFIVSPFGMLPDKPTMMKLSGTFMKPVGASKQFFIVESYEELVVKKNNGL